MRGSQRDKDGNKKSYKTLKYNQQIGLRDQRAETERESHYEIVEDILHEKKKFH